MEDVGEGPGVAVYVWTEHIGGSGLSSLYALMGWIVPTTHGYVGSWASVFFLLGHLPLGLPARAALLGLEPRQFVGKGEVFRAWGPRCSELHQLSVGPEGLDFRGPVGASLASK